MTQLPPLQENQKEKIRPDSRWEILAGLRFLLALVVVAGHLNWFVPPAQPWIFLESLGGTAAVIGFLIISGYSIGHSLDRRPVGFYRRRVLRIYPLYVTAILFSLLPYWSGADALVAPHAAFPRPHAWTVIGNLLLLQNIICQPIDSNMLLWTLGIEVICYLLAPLFRKAPTPILALLITASATAYALFPKMGFAHYSTLLYGLPLGLFLWAWLAGFVLHRSRNSVRVGLVIAVLCAMLSLLNKAYDTSLFLETVVGSALLVTFASRLWIGQSPGRFLKYLGNLSYPIYLFHLPALITAYGIFSIKNPFGLLTIILVVSAAFEFIESIVRRILGRSWNSNVIPTTA